MPDAAPHACVNPSPVEALAENTLSVEQRRIAQQHLEHCAACRSAFRALTADQFPRLRSYTVLERIGGGAFGDVYKAIHHVKERTEALKVLHAEAQFSTAAFANEIHLIAQLQHPNLATLYEAQLVTRPFYYTMELVEGRQLDAHFRSARVSVADRIEILRGVALAMDHAHARGVVHLDLKPQNILIDAAGQPRIVDFGIARKLALAGGGPPVSPTRPRQPEGTDGYIAPEVQVGRPVDGRADIYALGVLLYQSLTGKSLPAGGPAADLAARLRRRGIARAADLFAVVARALEEEPARRYPTCAELAEELGRYLAAGPVQARRRRPPGYRAARTVTREFRSHPRLVYGSLLLIIAAALTLAFRGSLAPGAGLPGARGQVVLVAFGPSTIDALHRGHIGADLDGLAVQNRKSWRMLYGTLMETLARASPRAVVWDYFFPDCHPQYDAAFLRGVAALQAKGSPVVIGCAELDLNGQPIGCGPLLEAAHACGALLGVKPDTASYELFVPLCIRRGLAPPAPTLPLAAFAAARYPDCELDLRLQGERVLVCYRRRHYAEGESAWRSEVDEFPVALRERDQVARILRRDDEVLSVRVRQAAEGAWNQRMIPFEEVLTASTSQLKSWFDGRVVLAGQMLPGQDLHRTSRGTEVYGCEVQAQALDEFLARSYLRRFSGWGLAVRVLLWCLLAGVLVPLVPAGPYGSTRAAKLVCLGLCVVGLMITATGLTALSSRGAVEAVLAAGAVLVSSSALYLCRSAHTRLARVAPGPGWPPPEEAAAISAGGTGATPSAARGDR
jgi:hypothetical protein